MPSPSPGTATSALIARRRELGIDLLDEVWDGEYVVAPGRSAAHTLVDRQLALVIEPYARSRGLMSSALFQPRHRERLLGARRRLPPVHADRGVRADRRDRRGGALSRRQDSREDRLLCRARSRRNRDRRPATTARGVLAAVRQAVHPGLGKSAAGGNWGGSGGGHPMAVRGTARSCLSDPLNAAGAKSMQIGSRPGHRAADRTSMQGGLGKRQRARPLEAGVSVYLDPMKCGSGKSRDC